MPNKNLERWHRLWMRIGAKGDPLRVWLNLIRRYAEPQRAYHTLEHIDRCLDELSASRHFAPDSDAVEFALWYHDAIYDTGAEDNEEKSAELAVKVINDILLPENFANHVQKLILATKKHIAPANNLSARLLLDIDLAILGRPEKEFDEYECRIRKEYEWVPDEIFREKRIADLTSFLDRKQIYSTPFFHKKYEEKARKNIDRSIARLLHPNRR